MSLTRHARSARNPAAVGVRSAEREITPCAHPHHRDCHRDRIDVGAHLGSTRQGFQAYFHCHGTVGPTQASPPLDSLELSGVPTAGTVGDRFPLKVIATNLHGETSDVTTRVTWSSSSAATAAVSGSELMLVGANAGRNALTDESSFYSLPSLVQGSVTIRVTRSGYESAESTAVLSADRLLDLSIAALPPPPFTGATFDVRVVVASNNCGVDLPSSGRLVLSGTMRRLTIRIQGGFEREYSGSLEPDGTFTGSAGLAGARVDGADWIGHGVSTIKGLIVDSNVSGVEKIASHLCPNGLGIVGVGFASR